METSLIVTSHSLLRMRIKNPRTGICELYNELLKNQNIFRKPVIYWGFGINNQVTISYLSNGYLINKDLPIFYDFRQRGYANKISVSKYLTHITNNYNNSYHIMPILRIYDLEYAIIAKI